MAPPTAGASTDSTWRLLGQIWFVTTFGGFFAVEFENGLWPFDEADACPGDYDHHQAQYDPGYETCRARS